VIVDYHMHLRDSEERIAHSVEAVERFVEVAAARDVDEIGFTEHVYYFRQTLEVWDLPYQVERCVYDLDAYCGAVVEAKQRGLPVKLGLEVDYVAERQELLSELLSPYPWDYLLGSVHWLDGLAVDLRPGVWERMDVETVWERYVDALCELAEGNAVDVLAHPDLAKIFGLRPDAGTLAALHERVADGVAAAGIAVEVSTAGLRKPVGELYPDASLLAACATRGVGITLASDAHVPGLVGHELARAVEYARAAGFDTVTVFDSRVATQASMS
jgi:histidinol-phosphatase (PHP family)